MSAVGEWTVFRRKVGATMLVLLLLLSTIVIISTAPEGVEAARVSPIRTSSGWALEVVDGRNDTGYSTSMAIDRFGHNHIAYAQYDDYTVYYATDSSGTWKIESLNDLVDVEQEISLAVDADGHAHVLYMRYYDEYENLTYATNAGGSWESTVIGPKVSGMYNDILIDKNGVIHIAYTLSDDSWNNNVLMYVNNSGGSWNTPVLVDDNGGEVGMHCSLAVTDIGYIYIVYQVKSGTDQFLRLAQKTPSMDWSSSSLDFTVDDDKLGHYASITSFGDELHISHYDYGSYDLIYKHFDGVAWGASEVVDGDGEVGEYSSIAVDSKGVPHIAYYDSSNSALKMAELMGTDWTLSMIDASPRYAGRFCSLAIGPDDMVSISYMDEGYYDLCLASEDIWTTEEVQSGSGMGQTSSMVLDDDGNSYIAYYDTANKDLRFATNSGGTWISELVDSDGDVGARLSLDIDRDRYVHISYLDRADPTNKTGYMKYATNAGGSWNVTVLAQIDVDYTQVSSLKMDSAGDAHIFFFNGTDDAQDLWYATNSGGSWIASQFEACTIDYYYVGGDNSLFIDLNDNLHVAYRRSYKHDSDYRADVVYANNVGGTWTYEIAASGPKFGQSSSLAIDLNGNAHIAFRDNANFALVYATNAGGSWANYTLASGVGDAPSLGADSQGDVHIAFTNITDKSQKYLTNTNGNWTLTNVATIDTTDSRSSLALDSGDRAHISYYDSTTGEKGLMHSTNTAWKLTTLYDGPITFAPGQSSIKVDKNGWTHVCYYVTKNTSLMYANNVGGTWRYQLVDGAGTVQAGGFCSMALDSAGKAHISYRDSLNGKLKYANNTGREWTNITLDVHVSVSYVTSIAVDGDGKAYISYYASGTKDLKCATNKGGSWAYCVVDDSANDAGTYSSIAIQGIARAYRPHISYYDATNGDLMYAEFTGTTWATDSWTLTPIYASASDAGKYNSIALDKSGKAFVSFFDDTYDNLMLASNADGHWDFMTVDDTAGMYTSLARSGSGALYIVYYDDVNDNLKLATNLNGGYPTDGGWGIATVDCVGDVGKNPSISIGPQNTVHISYVDDTRDALKCAQMMAEPSTPLSLTAVATLNDVALSWSAPKLDHGMAVTGYVLERTTAADSTLELIEVGNVLTYSDNDLESGDYSYRVAAMNAVGTSGFSTKADVTVNTEGLSLPGAPTDLDADAGNGTVTLTWDAPDDDGGLPITGYNVYRGSSEGNLTLLDTIGSVTTYVDDTVVNNQTYYYKVSAVNALGEGPATDVEEATPTSEGGDDDDDEGGSNTMLYIIIAVVVISAVAVVAFLFLRKK